MYSVLSTPRLSFDSTPDELVRLAVDHGFEAVEPVLPAFTGTPAEADRFVSQVRSAGLGWGPASLPHTIGPETSDTDFDALLESLRTALPRLRAAGGDRLSIWMPSAYHEVPFETALGIYRDRLNALTPMLAAHSLRLALEYVGPLTWRTGHRFDFIHNLAGVQELLVGVDEPAVFGVVADSFHWYCAGKSVEDLASASNILVVDLNDAVPGVPRAEQLDLQRAQPGATGVIDLDGFLTAIRSTGFAGPVHSEPFSASLDQQPPQVRVAEARAALAAVLAHT